ncbi:glutamate--cysteine ligase [Ancistrocladus abbreviatus]
MAVISWGGGPYCINAETVCCEYGSKDSYINTSSIAWNSVKKAQNLHLGITKAGGKRKGGMTVAVSPPIEDVVISVETLTKEDLLGYLASGCKPKEKWRLIKAANIRITETDLNEREAGIVRSIPGGEGDLWRNSRSAQSWKR